MFLVIIINYYYLLSGRRNSGCSSPSQNSQDWASLSSEEFPWRSPVPDKQHKTIKSGKGVFKTDTIWMNSDEISECTGRGIDSDFEPDGTITACSLRPLCSSIGEFNSSMKVS